MEHIIGKELVARQYARGRTMAREHRADHRTSVGREPEQLRGTGGQKRAAFPEQKALEP
jgi:hypothetical protein